MLIEDIRIPIRFVLNEKKQRPIEFVFG